MNTIAAISSPIGAGGIGIVRVCGEQALKIADAIFNFSHADKLGKNVWEPLKMHFGTFCARDFCDKGYAVFFPAKQAFAGEDTVEFYLHGGIRIMQGALDTVLFNGARLAENGEFTKRAFLNGRLSLADAEGVIDMINAESAAALRAAYRMMNGEIAAKINYISDVLEGIIAGLEAALDYPDEMEDEVLPPLKGELEKVVNDINLLLASAKNGRLAKFGITVAIAGKTNAGKSSLMNALLNTNRAIVTPIAGTTRDTVEDSFECDGVKINLIDTAGIRESEDAVENEGIIRAKSAFDSADVILHVIDKTDTEVDGLQFANKLVMTVYNKCDVAGFACPRMAHTYAVSAKTGENVDVLRHAIAALYKENKTVGGEIITEQRHISALYRAKNAILSAISAIDTTVDCTLIDLRSAYDALGEITGKTATEDIIDGIFAKFCVGK